MFLILFLFFVVAGDCDVHPWCVWGCFTDFCFSFCDTLRLWSWQLICASFSPSTGFTAAGERPSYQNFRSNYFLRSYLPFIVLVDKNQHSTRCHRCNKAVSALYRILMWINVWVLMFDHKKDYWQLLSVSRDVILPLNVSAREIAIIWGNEWLYYDRF